MRQLTFLEVGLEERRLVVLDLPVLHRRAAQRVVQLHRLDGRRPRLILKWGTDISPLISTFEQP